MPTILRIGAYRFFFFSLEGNEPPHIHIESQDKLAKFWLNPVSLGNTLGFRKHELTRLKTMVIEYRLYFLEKWHEYFSRSV